MDRDAIAVRCSVSRTPSAFVLAVGARGARAAVWRAALERCGGCVARAAAEFGFTKQRGSALTGEHGLRDVARELRRAAGQPATGRPRIRPRKSKT